MKEQKNSPAPKVEKPKVEQPKLSIKDEVGALKNTLVFLERVTINGKAEVIEYIACSNYLESKITELEEDAK